MPNRREGLSWLLHAIWFKGWAEYQWARLRSVPGAFWGFWKASWKKSQLMNVWSSAWWALYGLLLGMWAHQTAQDPSQGMWLAWTQLCMGVLVSLLPLLQIIMLQERAAHWERCAHEVLHDYQAYVETVGRRESLALREAIRKQPVTILH